MINSKVSSFSCRNQYVSISLCLFGFVISLISFFPGYMSVDSVQQYEQAISGNYDDWHPPIMAFVWRVLNYIHKGPESLFILHLFVLWVSLAIMAIRLKNYRASWLVCTIGLLPWVVNFSGILWKDMGGAFALLGCVAIILGKPNWRSISAFVLLLFYASNVRHNMLIPAVPICFFAFHLWMKLPINRSVLATVALTIVIKVTGGFLTYNILASDKSNPENFMIVDDLAQISLIEEKSLIPGVKLSEIQECASVEVNGTALVARHVCLLNKPSYSENDPMLGGSLKDAWL